MEGKKIEKEHTTKQDVDGQQLITEEQSDGPMLRFQEECYGMDQIGYCADEENSDPEPTQSAPISWRGQFSQQNSR